VTSYYNWRLAKTNRHITGFNNKNWQNVSSGLQCRLMQPFVWAERVARTMRAGQAAKTGVAGSAMLAYVFGFLATLIQGVQALVCARRVAWTVGGS
jgi:hypothetical protein